MRGSRWMPSQRHKEKMHWMCTYATDRKLFGVVVAENEQVIDDYVRNAGIESNLKNSPRYSCSRSIGCGAEASFQLSPLEWSCSTEGQP